MACYRDRIIALYLLFFCLPGLGGTATLHLATLEYPPYMIDTGQGANGLAVDIIRTAFARMKQPIEIQFLPVSRGQSMLKTGLIDGFFSIKKTRERELDYLFPQQPLIRQDYVFFARKDSHWNFHGHWPDLANATIGVVSNTSYGQLFDKAVQNGLVGKLDATFSHEMNFRKLLAGRMDAVICSRLVGLYYLKTLDTSGLIAISGPVVETTDSYLAFTRKKDLQDVARKFDLTMKNMELDGTLDTLIKTYQLPQARVPHGVRSHPRN